MAIEETNKLLEGIAYFEQILQMMPEDRSTLEFLCIAYEQIGDWEKYRQVLVSLANVLVRERDVESAEKLLENLKKHEEPAIKAAELKIRAMLAPAMDKPSDSSWKTVGKTEGRSQRGAKAVAVEAELGLMKWLASNKIVEQELADRVCEQLRALGTAHGDFLISALSVLENENPGVAETAVSCIADETQTPPISLELFEQYQAMSKDLPEEFVKVRGVVPFGKIADDTLVALANPMDEGLKAEVASRLGGRCHYYFVPPLSLGIVHGKLYPETKK